MEAKVNANELRRDKIYDRRAHREKLYLQQKVAWLIALHARTGFIVQVICEVWQLLYVFVVMEV